MSYTAQNLKKFIVEFRMFILNLEKYLMFIGPCIFVEE